MRIVLIAAVLHLGLTLCINTAEAQIPHRTGQSIQPVYEGWTTNPDGTHTLWFGYLNRNYDERPHVPVGEANFFEPGGPDRGQPTYFYNRRQNFVFSVTVPADWGDRDLVWTVVHNGETYRAIGSLWVSWKLDEGVWRANRGSGIGGREGVELVNQPPAVRISGGQRVRAQVGEAVRLVAVATDDGVPGGRTGFVFGGEGVGRVLPPLPNRLPVFGGNHSGAASGVGGPTDQNRVNVAASFQTGLAVTWALHRGPADVRFSARSNPVTSGQETETTVTFTRPGTYTIRAVADDSSYLTYADVIVEVDASR